jgi:serine/threonine protein kinase
LKATAPKNQDFARAFRCKKIDIPLASMSYCINPNCPKPQNPENLLFCQSCGSDLLLNGHYRVTSILGEGGFAKTYEVSDCGTPKVLKVLFLHQEKAISLFQQEARVLSRLNHPGIPRVESDGYFTFYPKNSDQSVYCLVMEKIAGLDLEEWMNERNHQPISESLAINWLKELAEILDRVHQQNYFHRDIKPANIMLRSSADSLNTERRELALIDFGTARAITATVLGGRHNGTQIFSAGYSPIEQVNGQAVPQSDFFALGRTFVYLLTGLPPSDLPVDADTGDLIWRDRANLSESVADLIDNLMGLFPVNRPQNAQIILQRLAEIEGALDQVQPPSAKVKSASGSHNIQPASYSAAGFWRRFYAYLIDTTTVTLGGGIIGSFLINHVYNLIQEPWQALGVFLGAMVLSALGTFGSFFGLLIAALAIVGSGRSLGGVDSVLLAVVLIGIGLKWLYFTVLECSPLQATLGKRRLKLVVTDAQGKQISWGRANRRYWSKTVSGSILCIGFIMAGFNRKKQALHDIIADTLVSKKI